MMNCLVFSNEFNFTQSFRQDKRTVTKRTGKQEDMKGAKAYCNNIL